MLSGIRVFSSDSVWQQILADFNATVVQDKMFADVNVDDLRLDLPISPAKLKSCIMAAADCAGVLESIFGHPVSLSRLQSQIVVRLFQSGGMTADELKVALGYAESANTHTVDTAIYGLRKIFGHEFIKNDQGVYKIGRI